MSWSTDGVGLADVLEPVLNAEDGDDSALVQAVTDVAEALAALGVLIVDRAGQPVHGVTDERAVIGALATYARNLAQEGRLDEAVEVGELMDRVDRLRYRPRRRRVA
ncbi:hypothetical protein [Azospirillum sp.]|uniref:hypothetical protein n=1 Tax=Azospirillum sp. TaxID=34012 RepID=UPI002D6AB832|nr:hypothetical protein [Azospirillum sp.]HYD68738.1 hypothetical protein [Azospirillum sp.]